MMCWQAPGRSTRGGVRPSCFIGGSVLSMVLLALACAPSGEGANVAIGSSTEAVAGRTEPMELGLPSDADAFPDLDLDLDWPWWRGPGRDGQASASAQPPTRLDPAAAKWSTPVPGRGHSSPIVVGQRVFLMTALEDSQRHLVVAFDRQDGSELWRTELNQGGFPAKNHPKNTEASPTLACDGQRIFATVFHHQKIELVALDLDGAIQWRVDVCRFNPRLYEYGYSGSPVLYRDLVIVSAEYDGPSGIHAFRRDTGQRVWRAEREASISFSSPTIAHLQSRDQLLISGVGKISSYDPVTGKRLWQVAGSATATCGTAVWDRQRVYASGGFPQSETVAIEIGDSPRMKWKANQKCYEQSMIVIDGYLYALTDGGIMYCWRAADGQEMWKHRLRGPVSASPIFAAGHLYWANEAGTLYVIRPNPEAFQLVEENQVGSDAFPSPAVSGDQLFLRVGTGRGNQRQEMLYCFQ